jgi:hypothetical protein
MCEQGPLRGLTGAAAGVERTGRGGWDWWEELALREAAEG